MIDTAENSPIRLLYVDDDVALVRLQQKLLQRQGFKVLHASDSDAALEAIVAGNVDVIALDHYLGDGTGLNFLGRIADLPDPPPVVYVTGSSESSVAVAALKAGASDFVSKSLDDEFGILLVAALKQAVENAQLKKAKQEADREIHRARERAEVLLAEVNHRVSNSLALVASMVRLQANLVVDQIAKDALHETETRIYAISLVHKRLYTAGEVTTVPLDEYLGGLLEHLGSSMRGKGHGATLFVELEPVRLKTDASISLGVIVAEWVTNAFKYAYPATTAGEIRVKLQTMPDGQIELTVADDGVGRDEALKPKGTGLGTRIVKAMAQSMDGSISYANSLPGLTARLVFSGG